jgi:hypothetical protein
MRGGAFPWRRCISAEVSGAWRGDGHRAASGAATHYGGGGGMSSRQLRLGALPWR